LLALCVFVAVSSGSLLIYMMLCKRVGRTPSRGKVSADMWDDFYPGSATLKSPVEDPLFNEPPGKAIAGGALRLGFPIALVVMIVLAGFVLLAAREFVRLRFEQVISKITSDRPSEVDFARNKSILPDFKLPDFRVQPIQPGQLPLDGMRRFGTPSGQSFGAASGDGASFRFKSPVNPPPLAVRIDKVLPSRA
jgi:hypothetical protein